MFRFTGSIILTLLFMFSVQLGARRPVAEKGVLDLRETEGKIKLQNLGGEWAFYWKALVEPGQVNDHLLPDTYATVPSYWTSYEENISDVTGFGYGTYRLQILLPTGYRDSLCLQVPVFDTSYELYLNGKSTCNNGKVGKTREQSSPAYDPIVHCFYNTSDTLDILVHVANFSHRRGGFWLNMKLGNKDDLLKRYETSKIINYSIIGILFGTFLLFLVFFAMERKNPVFLYFSLTTLGVLFRLWNTGLYPSNYILEQSWEFTVKSEYIGLFIAFSFGMLYLHKLYPSKKMEKLTVINALLFLALAILTIFTKTYVFSYSAYVLYTLALLFLPYYFYRSFLGMMKKRVEDASMFLTFLLFLTAVINDILVAQSISPVNLPYLVPFTFLLFIAAQVIILIAQWISNLQERIKMHNELQHINRNLENIIDKRTVDLNHTNRELKNALELKNRMFSIIAHDLKSPIATLAQYADLMVEEVGHDKNDDIIHELRRLSYSSVDLIENMLHWGMKQENHIQYHPEKVSLADIVRGLSVFYQASLKRKNITLKEQVDESLTAYCDPSLLKISMRNIISNAVKFSNENGKITVLARKDNDHVVVSITDTGIGMEQQKVDQILSNNVETTRGTAGEKGTGLGLMVVKDLVEINKGTFHIESKPGSGTTISFTLPGKP